MGKHWKQPNPADIEVDATHALMTEETMNALSDYSCTNPSGVYDGKMWRRRRDYNDESKGYFLCWYGPSEDPEQCSINKRIILAV